MTGKIGEHYEVVQELRRGAWVTVYEARHTILGRRTLIKWLNPGSREDEELVGRLRREARLGASVDHRNIARIYEVGEADGRPYVAIEWIKGEDLDVVLQREGSFSVEKTLRLAADLLSGLHAIHQAGVVHRDLSPTNVRITDDGRARITDFGLATGPFKVNYTMPGSIVGTPGYLAPEQAAGKDVDVRADLFACGVLIYEALTGQPLFKEDDLLATIKKVRQYHPLPLEENYPDLPAGFDEWIMSLLEKNPDGRLESAAKALRELGKLTGNTELQKVKEKSLSKTRILMTSALAVPLILAALILPNYLGVDSPISLPPLSDSSNIEKPVDELSNEVPEVSAEKIEEPVDEKEGAVNDPSFTEVRNPVTTENRSTEAEAENVGNESQTEQINEENNLPIDPNIPGYIQIRTQPWATVYLNAVHVGSTPSLRLIESDPGPLYLTLHNPGFPPVPIDTSLNSGDTLKLSIDLLKHVTILKISASPWANITLDESPVGSTPLQAPLYISPGTHTLILEHPEFGQVVKRVVAEPGKTLEIHSNMEKEGTKFATSSAGGKNDE